MKRTLGAIGGTSRARWLATVAAASVLFGAAPAIAQDANTNLRLNKVEAEVRALQRKVFPGADGKFFEPQISGTPTPTPAPGAPSTTPLSDVLTRMDAVEARMAQLTAQVEQNTNRIGQLEAKLAAAAPAQSDFVPGPSATGPMPSGSVPASSGPAPLPMPVAAAPRPAPTPVAAAPKPTAPSNSRIDGVKAIVKPQSADPGDDEYSYGFRLWEAKYYPEAQQQLKLYLEKYPKHARASFGRNLLGRAYLDDGNLGEAAKWFLQNFQTDKRGDRASDSLLYLAVSMKQLKDTKRACIALSEFSETYAAEAAGRLAGIYNTTRNGLACS